MYIGLFLIILGLIIKYGKLYILISGYNTMPKKERKKYDIEKIGTLMRNTMFAMGFAIIISDGIAIWINQPLIETISMYAVLLIGMVYLIKQTNSDKFKIDHSSD